MIIGHGEHRTALEVIARAEHNVIWAGYHEDDLPSTIGAADIFLSPPAAPTKVKRSARGDGLRRRAGHVPHRRNPHSSATSRAIDRRDVTPEPSRRT